MIEQLSYLPEPSLEELIPDIQECLARYQTGRLGAARAAIEGGQLLKMAKGKLLPGNGDWTRYLAQIGISPMNASRWTRLADTGLTPEQVLEQGGIVAVLKAARQPETESPAQSKGRQSSFGPDISNVHIHEDTRRAVAVVYEMLKQLQPERRKAYRAALTELDRAGINMFDYFEELEKVEGQAEYRQRAKADAARMIAQLLENEKEG